MAGVYIHIPFCRKACHYCNFHFSVSLKSKNDFVQALLKEITNRQNYAGNEGINTIYFGGGTPSLLDPADLQQIMGSLRKNFTIDENAEFTLEANPDDITVQQLKSWRALGINRLSIGIQSFNDTDLQWMNRAHNATQAIDAIAMARTEGFENFSIDLIYGSPALTDEEWMRNLQRATDMQVPHLSCYALTVETGTALHHMISKEKKSPVDADKQARHFMMMLEWLETNGYEHYEISNFAKPGQRSRHNSAYWQGSTYLGLGPSAHSFNGHSRQWNVSNNGLYITAMNNRTNFFEEEILTPIQRINELIMTALRTTEGLNLQELKKKFGDAAAAAVEKNSEKHLRNGNLVQQDQKFILTRQGKLFADGIAADLFLTDKQENILQYLSPTPAITEDLPQ